MYKNVEYFCEFLSSSCLLFLTKYFSMLFENNESIIKLLDLNTRKYFFMWRKGTTITILFTTDENDA